MTYTLVLLRHGESDWNAKNLFTGWVDVALTDKGRQEAVAGGELVVPPSVTGLIEVLVRRGTLTVLSPRQREVLWDFVGGLAARGTTVVYSTHNVGAAEHYPDRLLVLADGEQPQPGPLPGEVAPLGLGLAAGPGAVRAGGHRLTTSIVTSTPTTTTTAGPAARPRPAA